MPKGQCVAEPLLKALIVDDETLARRGIRQLLASHIDVTVVGECRDGADAVRTLEMHEVDLLFLDVQMPVLSGFDVMRQLIATRDISALPATIFLTAYEQFALEAFEVEAIDYLVKPASQERFDAALARVRRRRSSAPAVLAPEDAHTRHVVIHGARGKRLIPVQEILWIGADDYYAAIHTAGKRYLLRETMASLEARLDRTRFVRIHRGAIVNLDAVRELQRHDGEAALVLTDGTRVPVSRRRVATLGPLLRG